MRLVLSLLALVVMAANVVGRPLALVCSENNDVFVALNRAGERTARYDSVRQACERVQAGSSLLILADGYPTNAVKLDTDEWALIARKKLPVYIEFPATLPGVAVGAPRGTVWERGIVCSDAFMPELPKLRLLAIHDCHFVPVVCDHPLIAIGRVAGYDTAVFGLPKENFPILFEMPDRRLIVATTRLSSFATARYAPAEDWLRIWEFILHRLDPEGKPQRLTTAVCVAASYSPTEKLPRNFQRRAFARSADWIVKSGLLVTPDRQQQIEMKLRDGKETAAKPLGSLNSGDGSLGILEGYASGIQADGTQLQRLPLRADCQSESAMVLALDAGMSGKKSRRNIAANLLDYVYFDSGMCQGVRADPKHPAFGQIAWGDIARAWQIANYGDDNARTILSTVLVAACLKSDRWDESVAKALLANFRTTGKLGFRTDRLDIAPLEKKGWKAYRDGSPVNYSPHFEAGLWACNLWAYRQTGFHPFLEKATNAIAMTMRVYPAQWRWQDNMERARMLLCLAWLVRLDDAPPYREWLARVAADLIKQQQPSGALREQFHVTDDGRVPQSNEAYGTTETLLIQKNGDPVSDQLYVTGFALFGFHEAAAATGDPELKRAEDRLAEFVCRSQIRSERFSWLDGWWFRAFDDRRWEAWASSADAGWGAWSLEAGWAQAWGAATLALREMKTDYWSYTADVQISRPFQQWRNQMLQ
jgi:hypothetical protein